MSLSIDCGAQGYRIERRRNNIRAAEAGSLNSNQLAGGLSWQAIQEMQAMQAIRAAWAR
jgi:hypothetical protein